MQAYKKDEESGVGQFFQDKTVSRRFLTQLQPQKSSSYARAGPLLELELDCTVR